MAGAGCGYAIDERWDDDMVCGLDGCDDLNEQSLDAYVNECEGDYTDEVTGVTLLRDGVATKHVRKRWRGTKKVKAHAEVTDETSTKVTANVWKYEVDWSRVRSNRKGLPVTLQKRHRWHSCVT